MLWNRPTLAPRYASVGGTHETNKDKVTIPVIQARLALSSEMVRIVSLVQ